MFQSLPTILIRFEVGMTTFFKESGNWCVRYFQFWEPSKFSRLTMIVSAFWTFSFPAVRDFSRRSRSCPAGYRLLQPSTMALKTA